MNTLENRALVAMLISAMGENINREGLCETPSRFLSALEFWTSGYKQTPEKVLKEFTDGGEGYDELVFQKDIAVYSHCEHHIAPFFGTAYVAYIPNGKIVGLSKLSRLVEIYARRLTVQERITVQVVDALMKYLSPIGAAVSLHCRHLCMESRGVQKIGTVTVTTALRGCFKNEPDARAEFMSLVNAATKQGPL